MAGTATAPHPLQENADELHKFLAFFADGETELVTEVRVLRIPQGNGFSKNLYGFFDLATRGGRRATWDALTPCLKARPEFQPEGVYVTLNPVAPDLLARANHNLKPPPRGEDGSAKDVDVIRRRFLLLDVDPVRKRGISSTDDEKAAALDVFTAAVDDMAARGWPQPLKVDSGNGYHAYYPVDLPADDGGDVERSLKALAAKHDTPRAKVDTSVFNPSRIVKLPGTWTRKGDSIPRRPHRLCRVLSVPSRPAGTPAE